MCNMQTIVCSCLRKVKQIYYGQQVSRHEERNTNVVLKIVLHASINRSRHLSRLPTTLLLPIPQSSHLFRSRREKHLFRILCCQVVTWQEHNMNAVCGKTDDKQNRNNSHYGIFCNSHVSILCFPILFDLVFMLYTHHLLHSMGDLGNT